MKTTAMERIDREEERCLVTAGSSERYVLVVYLFSSFCFSVLLDGRENI